jgi:hypothetical protein
MHPDHIAKLLQNPKLARMDTTTVPAKHQPLADTYDASMDAGFEQATATYEAGRSNRRFERESPLAELSVDPISKLWYAAWSTCLLGGIEAEAGKNARLLLPVLRGTQSSFVHNLVFRALHWIHRNSEASVGPELYAELGEALATHAVRKTDVAR